MDSKEGWYALSHSCRLASIQNFEEYPWIGIYGQYSGECLCTALLVEARIKTLVASEVQTPCARRTHLAVILRIHVERSPTAVSS